MVYDTIFARSFSKYDQKKLGYGAFIACFLIALSLCTVFKPYLGPLPVTSKRLSMDVGLKMPRITESASSLKLRANDTSGSVPMVVDETSKSEVEMVVVAANNTGSSGETIFSDDAISFNSTVLAAASHGFSTNFTSRNETNGSIGSKTPGFNYTNAATSNETISSNRPLVSAPEINNESSSQQVIRGAMPEKLICNVERRTEFCDMNGDIRIHGKSSTIFMSASSTENTSWIISPYTRKEDKEAMNHVTKWSIKSGVMDGYGLPRCDQKHDVPAIVFSLAGYAGNNFHDYSDIVIPLYLASRQFDGEVKFLITNKNPRWINKFKTILRMLSRYEPIDIDKEEQVHCFTSMIVGLKRDPKELRIDPSESRHSMKDFRQFLGSAYSLKKSTAIKITNGHKRKPRLLILSRKRTRSFTNTNEIVRMARSLGYKVVAEEADSNVARVAATVNSCDVMMGVHGAGLTNMVFLPKNAILIQVLPIGGFEWLARTYFGEPSKGMNLRYLEYKIKTEESTLIQQYPSHHEVISNPSAIAKQGWNAFKSVYMEQQNVTLNIHRFRPTLLRALELLHE